MHSLKVWRSCFYTFFICALFIDNNSLRTFVIFYIIFFKFIIEYKKASVMKRPFLFVAV